MDAEELKRIIKEEVERVKSSNKKARISKSETKSDNQSKEVQTTELANSTSEDNSEQRAKDTVQVVEFSAVLDNGIVDKNEEAVNEFDLETLELLNLKNIKADVVLLFLENLFEKWHQKIKAEDDPIMKKIHREARKDLQPLFSKLRDNTLALNIVALIGEMVFDMQTRDYVRANNAYLRLAIGNAPWPIGVNSVIIHERTSQARISSNQVAHVLNDEVSRKWIQMLKRLITFCQKIRPPTDRSKLMP